MNSKDIDQILDHKAYPDEPDGAIMVETHISWVILTKHFGFKIKKPVKFSFLDFSTLSKRQYFCNRELELNQRLTEDMYLAVVPIVQSDSGIAIQGSSGEVIDYCVKMRRMDETQQMNLLLESEKVSSRHIDQLADKLSTFHAFTDVIEHPPNFEMMQEDFADILTSNDNVDLKAFIKDHLGLEAVQTVEESISLSERFLKTNRKRLAERHNEGFTVDGHGDLHSGNIFLLEEPVIFDCIEFNDSFRHLDVINELAFFCMDLDLYGREDLGIQFMQSYLPQYPCIFNEADQQIFEYYKLYRANVKMKVNSLKSMQAEDPGELERRLGLVEDYYTLLRRYLFNFTA